MAAMPLEAGHEKLIESVHQAAAAAGFEAGMLPCQARSTRTTGVSNPNGTVSNRLAQISFSWG
jgi:hypothetical protein